MRRLFGVSKEKTPLPTLDDISGKLGKRTEGIDEKIKQLDTQLAQFKEQLKTTKNPTAQNRIKQRAMQILKQKRMYEGQRDNIMNQQFNLDQASFAQSSVKETIEQVKVMKEFGKTMKAEMKQVKISEVEKLSDDLADLIDDSSYISEVMGRSYNIAEDAIDEDDLMAELDFLEEEMASDANADYLDADLSAPSAVSASASSSASIPSAPLASAPERESAAAAARRDAAALQ